MMKMKYMPTATQYKIIARVLDNGKITIPLDVRKYMNLKKGDYVEAIITKLDMSTPSENENIK
jgi:AbrB family looped-hinge helix DNA binding protein